MSQVPSPYPLALQMMIQIPVMKALYVFTRNKIPDLLLQEGPLTSQQISSKSLLKKSDTFRMLRTLQAFGYFSFDRKNLKWSNNQNTMPLISGPNSLRPQVMSMMNEFYLGYINMDKSIKQGEQKNSWGIHFDGKSYWQVLDQKQYIFERQNFNQLMVSNSMIHMPAILQAYKWKCFPCSSVVTDIGGGKGHLLKQIYKINPEINPILFDTKQMTKQAEQFWKDRPEQVKMVAGNFFQEVPQSNVYILKHILHDWSDQNCQKILKNIHKSASKVQNSKILLIQMVLDNSKPLNKFEAFLDLQMLTIYQGKQRTNQQWNNLLQKCGFKIDKIIPTQSQMFIIEAIIEKPV